MKFCDHFYQTVTIDEDGSRVRVCHFCGHITEDA